MDYSRFARLLLLLLATLNMRAQEVTTRRVFTVTLNTSAPAQLAIDRGRLIWRETDPGTGKLDFKYFSGVEFFLLDSNLVGLTAAISGDAIVWNTSDQFVKAFDIRTWTTTSLGQSYNPDFAQPVAVHNGFTAYARRKSGTGTEIVLHSFAAATDTVISGGVWNTSPSLHHRQMAWVAADSEVSTASSNIFFFDGKSARNISNTSSVHNGTPVLRDGQIAWIQSGGGFPRVKLFTEDTTITVAQASNASTIAAGYDASDGFAVAAFTDTVTGRSTIAICNAETRSTTTLSDSNGVTSLHVSSGVVAWQSGQGAGRRLHTYTIQGAFLEDVSGAENPVIDHGILAWTYGDAVELARSVTSTQLTSDGLNGWEQTKFKTIDSARVVLGNFANAVHMRLFAWSNGQTTKLADSATTNDLVMANDGYIIWRRNFDSLFYYDGVNPPVKFLDTIQTENPYVAGGSVGFFGSRTTVPDNIKHAWLYEIQPGKLTLLASDSGVTGNVLCFGNTACWLNGKTQRLMFYNGTSTSALSDSSTSYDYSYRNGKIVWSERRNGIWQVKLHDVAGNTTIQLTNGATSMVYPLTDGKYVAWYEHPGYPTRPADIILWWYDIASGRSWRVAHADYSTLYWNWVSNGKIAWAAGGNVVVFDGEVLSELTNDGFNVNSGVYLDREMLVWRRTPPSPAVGNGEIFTGKLSAHSVFDALGITGSVPLTVSFTNRSWEGARTYSWDFGDGGTSAERNPIHIYITPGRYSVALTVNGPTGPAVERKYRLVTARSTTGLGENASLIPLRTVLKQNFPNPFNPATVIRYELSAPAFVSLRIYDMLGREVATLVNEEKLSGMYEVTWNAAQFSSGVYFYTIRAGSFIKTEKLVLIR